MSFSRRPFRLLEESIARIEPDIVGISMLTPQLSAGTEASRIVRSLAPGALPACRRAPSTVSRGHNASSGLTAFPGQAEISFGMFLDGKDRERIPGAVYPERMAGGLESPRIVPDLDPCPA
jgi:hypothetical protein